MQDAAASFLSSTFASNDTSTQSSSIYEKKEAKEVKEAYRPPLTQVCESFNLFFCLID